MRAILALAMLVPSLSASCSGPDGSGLQDSPSIAERRLYGSAVGPGASRPLSPVPFDPTLKWDDDPTLKGIGRIEESPRMDPPRLLSEDRLPSSLVEPWYSFPSPAPFWSEGLPGLPQSGLFGGHPPQFH